MKRALLILLSLLTVGAFAFWIWLGPDPEEILAGIDVPPAPVLSPEAELATFRLAPGFRAELVAAEPLVVDPVAMDWDDLGRLYVVEMRGFMPNVDGTGEDAPTGRVVVLEDTDADGRMDRSDVFLDGLVLPRAIVVVPEGVLVGAPPDLWLCRDTDGDRACDAKIRLGDYAAERGNPEHQENGLLAGIDGWIYNAKSSRRFRLEGDRFEVQETVFRGQWGIAQDDAGHLFYNHNSAFLYGDAFPADYTLRQPATGAAVKKPGVNIPLAEGDKVFGVRVAPGLNRAYLPGTLRRDGRQDAPTAVSGLAVQRGDQYGPEFVGDAFIPEAAGSAVAHFRVSRDGLALEAEHRLYDDPDFGEREFLASSDERFRPVDAEFGPDGAIWIIDMYRGVIQHAHFVSDHLRAYIAAHGLEPPGETGRIWRIVRDDAPIPRKPPALDTLEQQIAALDHPNGWVRARASRRLATRATAETAEALGQLDRFGPMGRRHALWTLDRMSALTEAVWRHALADPDPEIRKIGLRVGERRFTNLEAVTPLLEDADPSVHLQALHTLGSLPPATRPVALLLDAGRSEEPLDMQATISGLSGLEMQALRSEIDRPDTADRHAWVAGLAAAAHLAARQSTDANAATTALLDLVLSGASDPHAVAILDGIVDAQRSPGSRGIQLDARHPLFDPERAPSTDVSTALASARLYFTWPGDPSPGGAAPLSAEDEARRTRGQALYAQTCATCHGKEGRGLAGLAPSLVGSSWVRDSDDWLVRIALHGLSGPVEIDGALWNSNMPGHGHDPRFDDDGLAGVLTHLRRAWGHAEDPVAPATIARIRAETRDRALPWTVAELVALPIEHRLDRYAGIYEVPILGIELEVRREDGSLLLGIPNGPAGPVREIGLGYFSSPEVSIQFEANESGEIDGATGTRDGTSFPLSKEQ